MDPAIESQVGPEVVAGRTRGGRSTQQDDFVCLHDPRSNTHLLVLADGMGGDGAGELASAGVVEAARVLWRAGRWRDQPGAIFLEQLCQEAHAELRRRGAALTHGEPHSTVVALLLKGGRAYWAHVGDSRLYRFQHGHLLGCTEDHSVVQARVRRGDIDAAQAASDRRPAPAAARTGRRAAAAGRSWLGDLAAWPVLRAVQRRGVGTICPPTSWHVWPARHPGEEASARGAGAACSSAAAGWATMRR